MIATLWLVGCGSLRQEPVEAAEVVTVEAPAAPAAPTAADADWKHFGAPFAVTEALPASAVLPDPSAHAGKPVRVKGELAEVCQKMGCWAVVRDDQGHSMRITMKDHAFGIDKDTAGRACDVEGELVKKAVDPKQLEHFASEGAKEHPEAGKTEAWEIVATTVAVSRS
jgi:hypothetical protein